VTPWLTGQQSQQPSPVIRSVTNEVLVPVVVRDAQGHAVGNLTKDNFEVFDNGKAQAITGFTIINRAVENAEVKSPASSPDGSAAVSPPLPPAQRFIVMLFDVYNLSDTDLAQAREAAITVIDSSLAPTDMAAVVSTSGANSGLTRDREKLKQAIQDLKIKALLRPNDKCPTIDYYQGDLIENKNDSVALQAAVIELLHCFRNILPEQAETIAQTAARRAVRLGVQNYRINLYLLRLVLNGMASLPGQHVVILVSSGFFTTGPEATTLKSEVLDIAARTNTVISAFDVRGLYTTNTGADVTTRVDPDSQRLLDRYRSESMEADADVMGELSDGSGGTFYHNHNDLEGGLRTLISGPDYTYLLAFPMPDPKSKRGHHSLKVKVNEPGLTVQARRGYSTPAPEKHRKQDARP